MKSGVRWIHRLWFMAFALLLVPGCASKRIVFQADPTFPPGDAYPLRVLLAAPLDSMDLTPFRDSMVHSLKDPARAVARVKCTWNSGVGRLAGRIARATELVSDVMSDSPRLAPTAAWMNCATDALSTPRFNVADTTALDPLVAEGIDFVVVPQNLSVRSRVESGSVGMFGPYLYATPTTEESFFSTPVALVNVRRHQVVWTGVVSSAGGSHRLGTTDFENEAYQWTFDLLSALGRKIREPGLGRRVRAVSEDDCP